MLTVLCGHRAHSCIASTPFPAIIDLDLLSNSAYSLSLLVLSPIHRMNPSWSRQWRTKDLGKPPPTDSFSLCFLSHWATSATFLAHQATKRPNVARTNSSVPHPYWMANSAYFYDSIQCHNRISWCNRVRHPSQLLLLHHCPRPHPLPCP
jgi:hypothetical protein